MHDGELRTMQTRLTRPCPCPAPSRPRWLLASLAAALLLGLVSGPLQAAPADAETPPTYVIGVEDLHYLPAYAVVDGTYVGYARDLLDAFAADAGVRFVYRPLPVPRLYASLDAGLIDFKFPDNPNWQPAFRESHTLTYSVPVARFLDATVVKTDRADTITVDDVTALATVSGFGPWPWLDRIEAGTVRLTENTDFTALVRQVLAGRVDGAYASMAVINHVLRHDLEAPGALVFAPQLPHHFGVYRLSTIAHPDLIAAFDAWMETNAAEVAALKARHGVEAGVPAAPDAEASDAQ